MREPEHRSAGAQPPRFRFQGALHSFTGASVCGRCPGLLETETKGVLPEGPLSWRVSHLRPYFCTRRGAEMLERSNHWKAF